MRNILFDFIKSYKEVIIYGCGNNGLFLQWILSRNHVYIHYMCDSNEKLWRTSIHGVCCISPKQLEEHREALVIVGIYKYEEVLKKLRDYDLKKVITWNQVEFLLRDLKDYHDDYICYRKMLLDRQPELKAILTSNIKFKNIHEGKRCFIIGNGPSVKSQKLALLKDEITFTVNQMAKSPQFQQIESNYHVWADPGFFNTDLKNEGDYQLLEIMRSLPGYTSCFFPYKAAHEYVEKFHLNESIDVNYYSSAADVYGDELVDLTDHIRDGYTVVQYAIRLAIYMGFKEIYLLGCECTTILNVINARLGNYSTVTHCYDIDKREKERARNMYMKLPMKAYYRSEQGVLEEYDIIKRYCDDHSILIFNCTPGGLLEELPRCSFDSIIHEI